MPTETYDLRNLTESPIIFGRATKPEPPAKHRPVVSLPPKGSVQITDAVLQQIGPDIIRAHVAEGHVIVYPPLPPAPTE